METANLLLQKKVTNPFTHEGQTQILTSKLKFSKLKADTQVPDPDPDPNKRKL
jgi:hypothetical protein